MSSPPYSVARQLIDEAHRRDPAYLARTTHAEDANAPSSSSASKSSQDELTYADEVEKWALQLLSRDETARAALASGPGGIPLVQLAARCQHLERFLTPRNTFPEGKMGYLKWRRHLYFKQADRAKELLAHAGVPAAQQNLVHKWVSKTDLQPGKLTGDAGTQLLEDAAVLVFLQDQLADFASQHQDYTKEKYISILSKTWKKLSSNAKDAAATIPLEEPLKSLVAEAIAEIDGQQQGGDEDTPANSSLAADTASSSTSARRQYDHKPIRPKTLAEAEALLASSTSSSTASPSASSSSAFGSRLLTDPSSYKSHNAWDHVEPPPSYLAQAADLLRAQAETRVPIETQEQVYHADAASHWDKFYSSHEHKFFKDRKWLSNEFPELEQLAREDSGQAGIFEIGCGAGNTVFPLLQRNRNQALHIYACDYSSEAVEVVKANAMYRVANGGVVGDVELQQAQRQSKADDEDDGDADKANVTNDAAPHAAAAAAAPTGSVTAFVWDLSSPTLPPTIAPGSLDVIVLIFVLSALHPREWQQAVANCHTLLKPGGLVLFRDYGRYDLPQLRFKKGRMLDDNFYVRGDGTRVYFFEQDELLTIFQAGPPQGEEGKYPNAKADLFDTVQLAVDRRMLVNRKEDKQMYRCWMQGKFVKR